MMLGPAAAFHFFPKLSLLTIIIVAVAGGFVQSSRRSLIVGFVILAIVAAVATLVFTPIATEPCSPL
jgi:membrane protein YdbS with pleckstrin-like domain